MKIINRLMKNKKLYLNYKKMNYLIIINNNNNQKLSKLIKLVERFRN